MPLTTTFAGASVRGFGFFSPLGGGAGGFALITPTSVTKAGTGSTATISANGSVEYSACTTLSLNGVFSADYDNYMVVIRGTETASASYEFRLRASGTDNSTSNSYTYQSLVISGTTEAGSRTISNKALLTATGTTRPNGITAYFYGPYLAQPTAYRTVMVGGNSSGEIADYGGTHNQSTAYDGFSLFIGSTTSFTGLVAVYGLEN